MTTFEQLDAAYEKACNDYHATRMGTKAHAAAGKRMDKAAQALEANRIQQKRMAGQPVSVYESLLIFN